MALRIEEKGIVDTLVYYFLQILQILNRPWRRTNRCLQLCQKPYYPTELLTRKRTDLNNIFLTTDDTIIVSDQASSVIISCIFIYVSKPKLVCRSKLALQNNTSTGIDSTRSYSSFEFMRERFQPLFEQEYRTGITEQQTTDNTSTDDNNPNYPGHMRLSVKQRFCSRTHRPIHYIPLPQVLQAPTYAEGQFMIPDKQDKWTRGLINNKLRQRQNVNLTMRCIENRLETFDYRWYMPRFNSLWTEKKYAESGFYLIDQRGNMDCYNCGMGLRHDIEDDPFEFHQNFSPHCTATILRDQTTNVGGILTGENKDAEKRG